MKKLIVPLFLQFSLLGFCKAQNLTIIEQDYNLARQESIAQKKMLIIDFYATWCGPCKVMDKKVFNDSLLSSELSKNFVLLKYNSEKDSVFNLALKHHIKLYPTYIIINTDGYVVNKQFGTGSNNYDEIPVRYSKFIKESILLNQEDKFIKGVSNSINLVYPKEAFITEKDERREKINAFLLSQEDRFSEIFFILSTMYLNEPLIQNFIVKNRQKYENLFGESDVYNLVKSIFYSKLFADVAIKDTVSFNQTIHVANANLKSNDFRTISNNMQNRMDIATRDFDKVIQRINDRKIKKEVEIFEINSVCWNIYEVCENEGVLKKCADLMKDVTEEKPEFGTIDTYARILYKMGDKERAKIEMAKGIKIGKINNDSIEDSEKWLKSIK